MAKVKDIAMQIRGVSYHPEDLRNTLDDDSIVLLRANNIKDGKLLLDDVVYVSKSKVAKQQYLQTGDILICASSGSKELVGKAAFVDSVKNPMTFGAFCKVVRPQPEYSEFLGHYFNSPVYRRKISALSAGANINNIKNEHIDNLDIQLVDEKERREIITILNKLNMLISLRKQQLAKLDELVKARFVEMFGDPKDNRSNLVKIGEIGDLTSGGTPPRSNSEYFNGSIRWYSAGELNSLYLPDSIEHISRTALSQSAAKLFEKGTLMIGMYDTAAFKMGILTEQSSSNQACANLKPTKQYRVIWLYYLFDIMKPIFLNERQGVRQKNLSLSKIRNFNIPSAPIDLQNNFSAFVERVEQQRQTVQQSLEKLELMKKALMQEYFG